VAIVGQLLGEKIVLTEFIAYGHLGEMLGGEEAVLSQRSAIIATYALCGFANFASIGIQLGGIGGIAPRRMGDLAALGLRAMIGGMLAAFMTATVAGIMLEGSTVVDQMGQQSEQSQESPDPPVED
jgi:CNT family concentrative nucleoside transporter